MADDRATFAERFPYDFATNPSGVLMPENIDSLIVESDPNDPGRDYSRNRSAYINLQRGLEARARKIPGSQYAEGGRTQYEYVRPTRGGSLKGAFVIPHSAIVALGQGDPEAGLAACDALFGHHPALGRGTIHPDIVRLVGNGSISAGHKVLAAFVKAAHHAHRKGAE